jgi:hypothetical protein
VETRFHRLHGSIRCSCTRCHRAIEPLPDAVEKETGETVTANDLERRAAAGWFEPLACDPPDNGVGIPLYMPSGIGFYLKLKREGHTAPEIHPYPRFVTMVTMPCTSSRVSVLCF